MNPSPDIFDHQPRILIVDDERYNQQLLEVMLAPEGFFLLSCGGPELLGRLRVQAPALRALYMSGYTEQSAATTTGLDRGLPFVQKPFTAAELVRQVRDALDR